MQTMGGGETLNEVLQHAPTLLGRLRAEHSVNVIVGEIYKTTVDQGFELVVPIIANGQQIGLYRHHEDTFGITDQKYNDQPTGDKPVVKIEREIDDS